MKKEIDKKSGNAKVAEKKKIKFKFHPVMIPILLVLSIIIFNLAVIIINNIKCRSLQKELENKISDCGYEIVATGSECGKFTYLGEGLTYLNTVVVKTDKQKYEIQMDFVDSRIDVTPLYEAKFSSTQYINDIEYDELNDVEDFSNYYVIYQIRLPKGTLLSDFDMRGH